MTRKCVVFAILLLLFVFLSGTAGAEEPVPSTPTDLDCMHEQTKTTIYFFDSPAYSSINTESHLVSGPASIETVCLDCGEVLFSETVENAEEIRPHSMKKGACVLCGFRKNTSVTKTALANAAGERTVIAREDDSAKGVLTLTMTNADLYKLTGENVYTILVQGKTGNVAVALNVTEMLGQTENTGTDLRLEMAEQEDDSVFASLYLVSDSGNRSQPGNAGITLRFYRETKSNIRVSLAPAGEDSLIETEAVWNEKGYWSVPYLQEGTYFLLQ